MGEQDNGQVSTLQRPTTDNSDAWRAYWKAQSWPWRTEPEIDAERQKYLAERRAIVPDIEKGIYPFKDIEPKLTRADVEWLLVTHENGRGPVDWSDVSQREREGLDLRGANLNGINLSFLPLTRVFASLKEDDLSSIEIQTINQYLAEVVHFEEVCHFAVHMERASLRGAYLEGAELDAAYMQGTDLFDAHLEAASLNVAHLEGASLRSAQFKGAQIIAAHLEGVDLGGATLDEADLRYTHLEDADFNSASLRKVILEGTHLEGTKFKFAHLEGAHIVEAHFEGKSVASNDLIRIRKWKATFPDILPPADLFGSFFDNETLLANSSFGSKESGSISIADVQWNNTNLAVLNWSEIIMLGDENEARKQKYDGKVKNRLTNLEFYKAAVRANRQLAVALQTQGLAVFWEVRSYVRLVFLFNSCGCFCVDMLHLAHERRKHMALQGIRIISSGIVQDPAINNGRPIIEGARVFVDRIIGHLENGMSIVEICHEYDLTPKQVQAVKQLGSEQVQYVRGYADAMENVL